MNRQPGGLLYERVVNFPGGDLFGMIPLPIDNSRSILINESYSTIMPMMGALGTKNATIFTQYLCSVPEPKSTGTMLLAILIADLVFLQAAWKIFNWITQGIVSARDSTAMVCKGCLSNAGYSAIEMKDENGRSAEEEEDANDIR
jgi:hypothetical protein